ncbi:mersacidin/lichenicidin family type 2 lantibiotic [Ktedonobacter robiniae]|uniref:Uncharacterized protein n=1 Tax=Ktedonobacter robiniae TaxID=2778365 RepID=A0ABQ3UR67_9CHLR|nr:mersacidin/lichenicidin family type 2 lantibiotic [Ktedonobacter robiniae]GHO54865.1 hypothetical protein KSB_33400 [Ktedonobacter robiniae]
MQFDMTRAWKDEEYRQSLSREQWAQLIENPAGEAELSEAELEQITGTGVGAGGGVAKSDVSAFGVKNNSYYCNNFSIRPTTNVDLGENDRNRNGLLGDLTIALFGDHTTRDRRNFTFDFGCSISGGLGNNVCIFGATNKEHTSIDAYLMQQGREAGLMPRPSFLFHDSIIACLYYIISWTFA